MWADELTERCASLPEKARHELLLFVRLLRRVPEFREELHALAPAGECIPPLEVIETLMEKYKGRLEA